MKKDRYIEDDTSGITFDPGPEQEPGVRPKPLVDPTKNIYQPLSPEMRELSRFLHGAPR